MNDERLNLPSASGMERMAYCPGSFAAEQGQPEVTTRLSERGDRIHAALEAESPDGLEPEEAGIVKDIIKARDKIAEEWFTSEHVAKKPIKPKIWKEWRFIIYDASGNPIATAKPDWVSQINKKVLIIDYKSGFKMPALGPSNMQVRTQVVAVAQDLADLDSVKAVVLRCSEEGFVASSAVVYTAETIQESIMELISISWRAGQPNAPRVPGQWCQYCKFAARCPERAAWALLPSVFIRDGQLLARINELTLTDLAFLQSRKKLAVDMFDLVSDRLKTFSPEELATVGLKLVPGAARRNITNIDLAYKILVEERKYLLPEQFRQCCKLGLGDSKTLVVERLLNAGLFPSKKAAEKCYDDIIEAAVDRKTASPSLGEL